MLEKMGLKPLLCFFTMCLFLPLTVLDQQFQMKSEMKSYQILEINISTDSRKKISHIICKSAVPSGTVIQCHNVV